MAVRGRATRLAACALLLGAASADRATAQSTARPADTRSADPERLTRTIDGLRAQVISLERVNADLASRLARVEQQFKAAHPVDPPAAPEKSGGLRDHRQELLERQQLREDVLRAIAPELAQLRDLRATFERHRHEYGAPSGGWIKSVDLPACQDCLVYFTNPSNHPTAAKVTGPPQP